MVCDVTEFRVLQCPTSLYDMKYIRVRLGRLWSRSSNQSSNQPFLHHIQSGNMAAMARKLRRLLQADDSHEYDNSSKILPSDDNFQNWTAREQQRYKNKQCSQPASPLPKSDKEEEGQTLTIPSNTRSTSSDSENITQASTPSSSITLDSTAATIHSNTTSTRSNSEGIKTSTQTSNDDAHSFPSFISSTKSYWLDSAGLFGTSPRHAIDWRKLIKKAKQQAKHAKKVHREKKPYFEKHVMFNQIWGHQK